MTDARITADHLSSGYFGTAVLHDLTFTLKEKGVYVVLGHNGAGKTTLFRTIAGVLRPLQGRLEVDGGGDADDAPLLTYLAHMDGIPDGMRVRDALRFYARILGSTETDIARVVDSLGVEDLVNKWFNPLSEGQRKKIALARSLLRPTPISILDEPTNNLDPATAKMMRDYVRRLARESIVLYSSHNLYEANDVGKFVLLIKQGRLVAFEEVDKITRTTYEIEIWADGEVDKLVDCTKDGDRYRLKLASPDDVPDLVKRLADGGIRIKEVREVGNPLENLYTELEK